MISDILSNEKNKKVVLTGNEAFIRGALEAGVSFVSQYPGTPVSDVGVTISELTKSVSNLYFQWASNEAASLEASAGASWSGIKSLCPMKHVGVNVASDPMSVIAINGPLSSSGDGGLVILVGGDPGSLGSHCEQNDRFYSWMFHMCHLEPSNVQEAKDFMKAGYEISSKFDVITYLRTTSRISHTREDIILDELNLEQTLEGNFEKNIPKYCSLPPHCITNHKKVYERMERLEPYSKRFNKIIPGDNKLGLITAGVPFGYLIEANRKLGLDNVPILKLGCINPINKNQVIEFCEDLETILIVEELEPFVEVQIKKIIQESGLAVKIYGHEYVRKYNELSVADVVQSLSKLTNIPIDQTDQKILSRYNKYSHLVPPRPPTFCAGCPERALIYCIRKATDEKQTIYAGDIGCYVMSFFPPLGITDWVICMGGGLGAAVGASKVNKKPVLALMGDSTFYHTGLPGIVNATYNQANVILFILDNAWTGMTGGHPNPNSGINGMGEIVEKPDIGQIVKSLGAEWVRVVDPYQPKSMINTIREAMQLSGLRVIVSKRECMLQYQKRNRESILSDPRKVYYWIDPERCQMCGECYEQLCCTALKRVMFNGEEVMSIDQARCTKCGVCQIACLNSAVVKTELNVHL
ncbi:MAG: indolepyruvate ferredoxin oxidoreductase subunit alpha [Promethearchaeota archaeon]|nr:MAG: indolepyruvate ferredoxin oxidoreductase subunit alpha [Candidatus Lokiarchaeota archaeon]